ncbi:MAG TPA: valine--tRNA ligase [Stellaceae bacterium]|nr:valine--tRNA ligase [Stellaceae bacterium]
MSDAPKQYDIAGTEAKWRKAWLENGVYAWDPKTPRADSYVVDTPPPTVSGILHIGHVYSYTQTDLIARFQRMTGKNVFYPMGFDDNGLPTERLVEKRRNIRAADLSREEFIRICHEEVQDAEQDFRNLFQEIAVSVDWKLEYQTISPHSRKISQLSVLDLFEKGHLYRRPQPSLWDPADRTALAQAEVVEKESPGTLWQVTFDLADGAIDGVGGIDIATTRPELMGACGALLIHPEHPRAKELLGKIVLTPLFRVPVPILADEKVDPEKGTGVVMCCTFGDTTDIEWWREHNLPTRVILGRDGRIAEFQGFGGADWPSKDVEGARGVIAQLTGLKVNAARTKMIELLTADGRITNETPVTRMVPSAERSGAPLEILVTPQWFVRVLDKKQALIDKGNEIAWHPEYMKVRLDSWIDGLKWDWCISRQRYFGVPFPFWYSKRKGEEGKIIAADPQDLPVNPLVDLPRGYTRDEVEPETDVLDTWATSSVSPQLNSWGISAEHMLDAERHAKLFPADLRPQAHEIIRTWAFYTIVKSYLHEDVAPWSDIAISGWCLAQDKTKMSKSKGNVVDPRDLLKRYGADVVRYWTATSKLGLDTALSEDVLKIGKRLQTKLWNAARFVMLQLDGFEGAPTTPAKDAASGIITEPFDRWVLSRLARAVRIATEKFAAYEYADAFETVERFFWADLCDNYLELVKGRAYGELGTSAQRLSAQTTLWHCLETVLRLIAPVMPHLTEELYAQHFPGRYAATGSVHARGQWPKLEDQLVDEAAERLGQAGVQLLMAVRKVKSERKVSIKTPISTLHLIGLTGDIGMLDPVLPDLRHTVAAEAISIGSNPAGEVIETEDGAYRLGVELAPAPAA